MRKQYSISTLKQNEKRVLDRNRQTLLPKLSFLSEQGFYLAGGTALALYLGHRMSVDFDFYRQQKFNGYGLFENISSQFPNQTKSSYIDKVTMICRVANIEVSCFQYKYNLVNALVDHKGVKLASVEDIAAMKAVAIVDRARQRDYFDIYYILEEFGVEQLLEFTKKKYPAFDPFHILQAITYFDEAEEDEEKDRINILDRNITWDYVKKEIFNQVKKYQLKNIQ